MYSVEFENDLFLFTTIFDWKAGMEGDGYLQPDDNNYFKIEGTYMIGYTTEDGDRLMLKVPADVTHVINESVKKERDEAIDKEIECYIQ